MNANNRVWEPDMSYVEQCRERWSLLKEQINGMNIEDARSIIDRSGFDPIDYYNRSENAMWHNNFVSNRLRVFYNDDGTNVEIRFG